MLLNEVYAALKGAVKLNYSADFYSAPILAVINATLTELPAHRRQPAAQPRQLSIHTNFFTTSLCII